MSDHLPECGVRKPCGVCGNITYGVCICDRLRACERRVRNQDIATHHADLQEAKALLASRDEAWYAGVDAAREAVLALPTDLALSDQDTVVYRADALAAIDALREEQK